MKKNYYYLAEVVCKETGEKAIIPVKEKENNEVITVSKGPLVAMEVTHWLVTNVTNDIIDRSTLYDMIDPAKGYRDGNGRGLEKIIIRRRSDCFDTRIKTFCMDNEIYPVGDRLGLINIFNILYNQILSS